MYSKMFVAGIKVNGQVLRESGDRVSVPFGSEYSIFLKNLNTVRVQVKVQVDGKEAINGLILGPNQTLDLERFVKDGNLIAGNRFKFIQRTADIEKHRGIGTDDGLIRIEYSTEQVKSVVDETIVRKHYSGSQVQKCSGGSSPLRALNCQQVQQNEQSGAVLDSDFGITVPGSVSNQTFQSVSGFETANPEVLIIRLRGEVKGKKVQTPVTVKTKMGCQTCGKKSKSSAEFCDKCGTALTVL